MTIYKVGDWVIRKDLNCRGYWRGYNNAPVQITDRTCVPVQDIEVDVFPGKWWAAELFNPSSPPSTDLKEWL